MLEEQLEKFGLSEKEAKVYLALLELGASTVNEIAKAAEVNRSTVYVVLEALEKKGLASGTQNEAIQRFKAAPPEKLGEIANENLKRQQNVASIVSDIIPDLKSLHSEQKHRPKVRVFEGKDGIREVYYSILDMPNAKELLVYADGATIAKEYPEFFKKNEERNNIGIPMRAVNPYSKINEVVIKRSKYPLDTFLLIPKDKFNFNSDLAIYGDVVAFVSRQDGLGVMIESKHMADAMRGHFELVWESSKSIGKLIN